MKTAFKRIAVYTVAVLLTVSVWSGFSRFTEPSLSSKKLKTNDAISGIYFLHGTKTSTIFPCPFTCFDMEPAVDTTTVAFATNVWLVPDKEDTLRFFGLLGADAGESGGNQFGEFVFLIELHDEDHYRIYGRINDNSEFEIDVRSMGPRYTASGSFTGNTIQIEGQYQYRQRTFAFDLEGVKIE